MFTRRAKANRLADGGALRASGDIPVTSSRAICWLAGMTLLVGCARPQAAVATTVGDAGAPSTSAPAASAAVALKPFGEPCVDDSECGGQVCFHKRLKAPDAGPEHRGSRDAVEHDGYCSLHCEDDSQCPVPMTGGRCGARGMCKRPG
jgi:hypothetical protein